MNKKVLVTLLAGCLLLGAAAPLSEARIVWRFGKKKAATEQPKDTVKKKTPYEKLFEKGDSLHRGLLNVHFCKGKVYFEVPDSLLGRTFILGSTV